MRNILLLEAEQKGATSPRALLAALEAEARAAGADRISIVGHAIINQKLLNLDPNLLARLGWTVRWINADTVEFVKELR
jgi:hypothetical protein